jgi:hypothetical protein
MLCGPLGGLSRVHQLPFFRVVRLVLGALCLLGASACLKRTNPEEFEFQQALQIDAGAPVVVAFHRQDASIAGEVFRAVGVATPKALRWGKLSDPVEVRIHPSHAALEEAVGYHDLPWLRAWATARVIHLQSPRTWGGGDTGERLAELLSHELTHTVMYQRAAARAGLPDIPVWFSEGMASCTADQGYRRQPASALGSYLRENPKANLLRPAPALYRDRRDLVYSAGHLAFLYLLEAYGDSAVSALLDAMRAGASFDRAFTQAFGEPPLVFEERLHAILREAGD